MAKGKSEQSEGVKVVTHNRRAKFEYHILETFEAGLVLSGDEIKSIRAGGISINEAYVRPHHGEIFLLGSHIKEYSHSSAREYDPTRARKLLLHKKEIDKLSGRVVEKGLTIVPLRVYLKRGKAKLEIALARGKDAPDKRKTVIDRERKREAQRAMKNR